MRCCLPLSVVACCLLFVCLMLFAVLARCSLCVAVRWKCVVVDACCCPMWLQLFSAVCLWLLFVVCVVLRCRLLVLVVMCCLFVVVCKWLLCVVCSLWHVVDRRVVSVGCCCSLLNVVCVRCRLLLCVMC